MMKNLTNKMKMHHTIVMPVDEFEKVIASVTKGLKTVEIDFDGSVYLNNSEKAITQNECDKLNVLNLLSEYFGVAFTSWHLDDGFFNPCIWLVFNSKWTEIHCSQFDENKGVYPVDAWRTSDDNEEGKVIAEIDLENHCVAYYDEDAKTDTYAQSVIQEFLSDDYVLTE